MSSGPKRSPAREESVVHFHAPCQLFPVNGRERQAIENGIVAFAEDEEARIRKRRAIDTSVVRRLHCRWSSAENAALSIAFGRERRNTVRGIASSVFG